MSGMADPRRLSKLELRTVFYVLGGTCIALWILYGVPLQNLNWDPSFYYAHVRSPVIDADLDFTNDGQPPFLAATPTRTGLAPSIWSAGPALVWAPFFFLGHTVTLIGRLLGFPLAVDGYGPFYLTFSAVGSVVVGWIGITWCYLIARRIAGPGPSLVSALSAGLASPLFYYMYKNPIMAHAPTVAVVSGVIYIWLRVIDDLDNPGLYFLLGLLIGIAALMRWQNGLFALIVPFALRIDRGQDGWLQGIVKRFGLAATGTVLGFMPQMAVWWRLYGAPLALPQGGGFLHWNRPELVLLLFGTNRGLFVWQPVALAGFVGLLAYTKRNRRLGVALVLVTALETYLNSVVRDWWGGGGFGPRRFDWFIPIQALCVGFLLQKIWNRWVWRTLILTLVTGCVMYQLALAQAHYYRVLPENQVFPIPQYDEGSPLSSDFFSQVLFGVLREPSYLVDVKPAIWATTAPPFRVMSALLEGYALDLQAIAICLATGLLISMVGAMYIATSALYNHGLPLDRQVAFAQRTAVVLSIWLVIVSLVFIGTGP